MRIEFAMFVIVGKNIFVKMYLPLPVFSKRSLDLLIPNDAPLHYIRNGNIYLTIYLPWNANIDEKFTNIAEKFAWHNGIIYWCPVRIDLIIFVVRCKDIFLTTYR